VELGSPEASEGVNAGDARPGDRVRIGAPTIGYLVVTVTAGTPAPHMIRTDWGDFGEHVCEPTDEPATPVPVEGELIIDESGFGLMPPEFARGPDGTWISLRPLGIPLPIDVTPRNGKPGDTELE
jgi:hypothetical protein